LPSPCTLRQCFIACQDNEQPLSARARAIGSAMMTGPLGEDWWTAHEVADFLGVQVTTWRSWVSRQKVPQPDARIGATALWKRETITLWAANRPRKGER
jgi:hypothetical protein